MNNALGRVSAFVQSRLSRLARQDEGATAVEYGLIIALIAGVIIAAVLLLGGNLQTLFNNLATVVGAHNNP